MLNTRPRGGGVYAGTATVTAGLLVDSARATVGVGATGGSTSCGPLLEPCRGGVSDPSGSLSGSENATRRGGASDPAGLREDSAMVGRRSRLAIEC